MQKSGPPPVEVSGTEAPRGRGRPREFDRSSALAKATRLFWQKGYEATSIADLTKAMGIGSPSLYAAFGSKEALYAEALRYYRETYDDFGWRRFFSACTAREAVEALLMDAAAVLTGCRVDVPRGCMTALSSVGDEGHPALGELVRSARAAGLDRLKARLRRAVKEGEIPASTNLHKLARFIQTVHTGMSILARDGASRADLEGVAEATLSAFDASIGVHKLNR